MYINRDISQQLKKHASWVQILLGPRQCGKSTLFAALAKQDGKSSPVKEITFDDLSLRQLAQRDPALFLDQFQPPLLLDEIQYTPNLLPEIKLRIDNIKKNNLLNNEEKLQPQILYRLTGSNQILLDKHIKESLAGRASYYFLNTLCVHEILGTFPQSNIFDILFKGGWPELYNNKDLSCVAYLNDYIRSYVEKDIVLSAGIQKIAEFQTVLRLLAARTGQLTDYSAIANDSGIRSVTVKEWSGLLEQASLIYFLKPYHSNLNKRLIKSSKLYFLDTGLASRLQGWANQEPLSISPQAGALFETLVLAEIVKFISNYQKNWNLFFWRTKEGEEVDFIIQTANGEIHAFDAKLAVSNNTHPMPIPPSFKKQFNYDKPLVLVTYGGEQLSLSKYCHRLSIADLHDYLTKLPN